MSTVVVLAGVAGAGATREGPIAVCWAGEARCGGPRTRSAGLGAGW